MPVDLYEMKLQQEEMSFAELKEEANLPNTYEIDVRDKTSSEIQAKNEEFWNKLQGQTQSGNNPFLSGSTSQNSSYLSPAFDFSRGLEDPYMQALVNLVNPQSQPDQHYFHSLPQVNYNSEASTVQSSSKRKRKMTPENEKLDKEARKCLEKERRERLKKGLKKLKDLLPNEYTNSSEKMAKFIVIEKMTEYAEILKAKIDRITEENESLKAKLGTVSGDE
eukprot:TRINITY_DN3172_c0_g1_i1.p1 TRINITY_DN3172_c0_g1~~TRINITY_DN3172_c0_g1_i1.p1  ORF type:complete len:221 (-),score=62.80 TRINITY_DN3172_c0_g1_i1:33-695(-)